MKNNRKIQAIRLIKFDAGKNSYTIDENGNVFSHHYNRFLKPDTDKDGYKIYTINGKKFKAHRLVAKYFLNKQSKNKSKIRHLDGNPSNNNFKNLCWGDDFENWQDRKNHGRDVNGVNNPNAKLSKKEIIEIRNHPKINKVLKILAEKYSVSRPLISKIRAKQLWKDL